MTRARPGLITLAPLLLTGVLAACGSISPPAPAAPPDLSTALAVDVPGFTPADAPGPPTTVCHEGNYGDAVPRVPGGLGAPTAVGYTTEDADLHAWAWRTASAEAAASAVDEVVADIDDCRFQIYFDSDTDGDGRIDAGGSEEQTAVPWSADPWTGLSASAQSYGGGSERVESRFAHGGDVVVLVVLTIHGDDDGLVSAAQTFLDGVADRLG
jgi:hypothetical protein